MKKTTRFNSRANNRPLSRVFLMVPILLAAGIITGSPQSDKLCGCLKEGKASGDRAKMNRCLVLQEELVAELGEETPAHKQFRKDMQACDREMMKSGSESGSAGMTYEQKTSEVCHCASESKGDRRKRMECMMLQDRHSKSFAAPEEKQKFLNETNVCF